MCSSVFYGRGLVNFVMHDAIFLDALAPMRIVDDYEESLATRCVLFGLR